MLTDSVVNKQPETVLLKVSQFCKLFSRLYIAHFVSSENFLISSNLQRFQGNLRKKFYPVTCTIFPVTCWFSSLYFSTVRQRNYNHPLSRTIFLVTCWFSSLYIFTVRQRNYNLYVSSEICYPVTCTIIPCNLLVLKFLHLYVQTA